MHVSKHSIWCLFCVNFLDLNTLRGSLPLNFWDSVDTIFPFPIFREFSARRAFNTGYGDQMFFWPGRICHIVLFAQPACQSITKIVETHIQTFDITRGTMFVNSQSFPWWFATEGQPTRKTSMSFACSPNDFVVFFNAAWELLLQLGVVKDHDFYLILLPF